MRGGKSHPFFPFGASGNFLGVDGRAAPVAFRMRHVFDLRDGWSSRQQAWFGTASALSQVAAHTVGAARAEELG